MLQVGIHDSENGSIRMPPPVKNRPRQAALSLAHQEAHTGGFESDGGNDFHSPVTAVVIDDRIS
jgi:hypothetical protein